MIDVTGNLWTFGDADGDASARVITTNGFVKANGECVMGRGCAKEARDRWPWLAQTLGAAINAWGNRCFYFPIGVEGQEFRRWHGIFDFDLATFPVKPARGPNGEPGWSVEADLSLIETSARQIVEMADKLGWDLVVMPRPGSGNGKLAYADVREVIAPILDDRFHVITFPGSRDR